MTKSVVVLSTLDTKGRETAFLKEQIERDGCCAILADIGVVGSPTIKADITREQLAEAGGTPLADLPQRTRLARRPRPSWSRAPPKLLGEMIKKGEAHAVVGLGGTQGNFQRHRRHAAASLRLPQADGLDPRRRRHFRLRRHQGHHDDVLGQRHSRPQSLHAEGPANASGRRGMAKIDEEVVAASNKPLMACSNFVRPHHAPGTPSSISNRRAMR